MGRDGRHRAWTRLRFPHVVPGRDDRRGGRGQTRRHPDGRVPALGLAAATVTPLHIKRMRLEKLALVEIDSDKLNATFPNMKPGITHAINDISIANGMHVGPSLPARAM